MRQVDLSGLRCPHLVLRLADAMRGLPRGTRVAVVATDPLSRIDIPFYLHRAGHALRDQRREDSRFVFVIEAGAAPQG